MADEEQSMERNASPHEPEELDVGCTCCFGMSVYTNAMMNKGEMPRCFGLEKEMYGTREDIEDLKSSTQSPPRDDFRLLGIGLSVYSREWMAEKKHLPFVVGLGVVSTHESDDDTRIDDRVMARMKRDQDTDSDNDHSFGHDSRAWEKDAVPIISRLQFPQVPAIAFDDVVKKSAESVQRSGEAMYNFWARRLDGFGDRYMESCKRIVLQMEIQAVNMPHNCMWLLDEMRERTFGKGDEDNK